MNSKVRKITQLSPANVPWHENNAPNLFNTVLCFFVFWWIFICLCDGREKHWTYKLCTKMTRSWNKTCFSTEKVQLWELNGTSQAIQKCKQKQINHKYPHKSFQIILSFPSLHIIHMMPKEPPLLSFSLFVLLYSHPSNSSHCLWHYHSILNLLPTIYFTLCAIR